MAILSATSATDLVSVLLAAAAFVVSIASFWMTSIRRPDVDVWGLVSADDLPGPYTRRNDLQIHTYLANSGASGTFVEMLAIDDYREENDRAPIWSGFRGESRAIEKPIMLDRFEAQHVTFARELEFNTGMPNLDVYAQRLNGLRSITVTLVWTFRQPRFFRPSLRRRVARRETVTIPVDDYRRRVIAFWRAEGHNLGDDAFDQDKIRRLLNLANVAEGLPDREARSDREQ